MQKATQTVVFTQQQQNAFVAQLQQDGTDVHGVEVRSNMMLAWLDMGCAYSNGAGTVRVEGEEQQGEVYVNGEMRCEYSTNEQYVTLHFADGLRRDYGNNDEGWDELAQDGLDCNYNTVDMY